MRRKSSERGLGAGAAGGGIDDQADPMPACRLALDQIHHMAEQPAQGGAQNVQNIKGRRGGTHDTGRFHVWHGRVSGG